MDLGLVPVLADAIRGYYENDELSDLCDLYGIELTLDGIKPAYVRLARDLITGINSPTKRRFLGTIIESMLTRAREGAGKSKWDRQEYHRSMVDSLSRLHDEFQRISSLPDSSGSYEYADPGTNGLTDDLKTSEIRHGALEDFPDLEKQIAETDYQERTTGSFLKDLPTGEGGTASAPMAGNEQKNTRIPNPRHVFVVHGRDERLRREFFAFLRALDLQPMEWSQALSENCHHIGYPRMSTHRLHLRPFFMSSHRLPDIRFRTITLYRLIKKEVTVWKRRSGRLPSWTT
jgi:hypothetical protein